MPIGLVLGRDQQMRVTTKSAIGKALTDNGRDNVVGHKRVLSHVALTLYIQVLTGVMEGDISKEWTACRIKVTLTPWVPPYTNFYFFFFHREEFRPHQYANLDICNGYLTYRAQCWLGVQVTKAGCTYRGRLLKTIGFTHMLLPCTGCTYVLPILCAHRHLKSWHNHQYNYESPTKTIAKTIDGDGAMCSQMKSKCLK